MSYDTTPVTLYIIGGSGAGKTTLAAAMRHCLPARFLVVDAPSAAAIVEPSVAPKIGIALLVISTVDGPQQETIDAIEAAKVAAIARVVVYLSKTDLTRDEELNELFELQVRELLSHSGYDADSATIVCGSAFDSRSISALVDAISTAVIAS